MAALTIAVQVIGGLAYSGVKAGIQTMIMQHTGGASLIGRVSGAIMPMFMGMTGILSIQILLKLQSYKGEDTNGRGNHMGILIIVAAALTPYLYHIHKRLNRLEKLVSELEKQRTENL